VWSVIGAISEATRLPVTTAVTCPTIRIHPVMIAHAAATAAVQLQGRFVLGVGSVEALNEHVTGDRWPPKPARNARLGACVEVIRDLLRGEEVTADGLVRVDRARLWTVPRQAPALLGAALSEETARWCGSWADGLLTVDRPPAGLRRVIDAFREGGGEGKPVRVQVKLAWAASDDEALAAAHEQWRTNVLDPVLMADLETVAQFEAAAAHVRPEDMTGAVRVSSDLGRHAAWLAEVLEAGVDELFLHHVPREQLAFIEAFGAKVLPEVGA
jgi:G6PDH family F420-dependent oxidoreductase